MHIPCRYTCGENGDLDYKEIKDTYSFQTADRYNLILLEKGNTIILVDGEKKCCIAPCIITLSENAKVDVLSAHMLQAKVISFHVSFLNLNITYDMINSGEYENICENYGFIPLNIFYEKNDKYLGILPLNTDAFKQVKDLYMKFYYAITKQMDNRWSCRARLFVNTILELLNQLYEEYVKGDNAIYDIKNPHVWVSMILQKIHSDYKKDISLITIAEYIHINKTTVSKCFKSITGYSVTDYIINYRIKCACYSLATTQIKLKELAEECGFKQESYFIRQFTAKMGMTPTEYRKHCIEKRQRDFARN